MVEKERTCYLCKEKIRECMGYVVASDFIDFMEGRRNDVRELCAKEVLRYDFKTLISLLHT
ncbi:MAG: hypothetical protein AABX85_02005 [Nanoarchaeota archaeon]|mgnify:CR=1 FL=1